MPRRFFLDGPVAGDVVSIAGLTAAHMTRSLRMRAGDTAVVVDAAGTEHGVRITEVANGMVVALRVWSRKATGDPALRLTVLQALPRDRMEDCIDALVEVGVADIRPVLTEHVVSRPGEDRVGRRVQRWRTVAAESAQLAGRASIPQVHAITDLATALRSLPENSPVVACTFDGTVALASMTADARLPLAVCIGPEGGFGARDLAALDARGATRAHLGGRVLRTRYAGMVAAALLLARAGDLAEPLTDDLAW